MLINHLSGKYYKEVLEVLQLLRAGVPFMDDLTISPVFLHAWIEFIFVFARVILHSSFD